jgi:DNA-binding CsgD family transcriptional regulator
MGEALGSRGEPALAEALLDRERELSILRAAVGSASGGGGAVVVLQGAAGLGKSRLLGAAREMAHGDGVPVLRARCEELESALPWALASSLLAPALEDMPAASRRRALKRAGEEAGELFAGGRTPPQETLEQGRVLRRAHALTWLTADLAERAGLLVAIDDLHWADEPSLHFVAYLCARAAELPVSVVLASRPRERSGEGDLLERIAGHPAARPIELRPLGPAAVAELVHDALDGGGEPEMVAVCSEATGGNPFYLRELLREFALARAEGATLDASTVCAVAPAGVVRSVCLRLERLGTAAVALARAVAVLGGGVSLHHAAELAKLALADAASALEALARAEILEADDPLGFVHPLAAAAVYEDLGVSRRGGLHLRAARMLARDRIDLARVAVHLLAGGRHGDEWVVETLREAAMNALAQGAGELAVQYLDRALEEPPTREQRAGVLGELGRAEAALGKPAACEHLRCALELTGEPQERARRMLELGRALAVAGDHPRAAKTLEEGLATLGSAHSELGRELQAAWWMSATLDTARRPSALAAQAPAVADWTGPLSHGQHQLLAQLAQQRAFEDGSAGEVRSVAERAWGAGELLAAEGSDGMTWSLVTGALLVVDELELDIEICDAVMDEARLRGSPMAYATASHCRSWPLLYRGQVDEAAADAQSALTARSDGWAVSVGAAVGSLVMASVERGETTQPRALLESALADPQIQRSSEYVLVLGAHGRLLIAEGRPGEALEVLLQAGEMLCQMGADQPGVLDWRVGASLAAGLVGDRDRALSLAQEALERARARSPRVLAAALRARARAQRGEQAVASLQEASALLGPSPPRLERAYVLVDLGAALRRVHRRAEARDPLLEGMGLAAAGGARTLASLARSELIAAGVQPGARGADGATGTLTPSERRVARLAAAGHSNREIAQRLFVTVKTVEYHLGNTYRKLDIKRRSQLARLLEAGPSESPDRSRSAASS